MLVTVLGCGTSTGVPLIGCACGVCRSRDQKDKRLRASILISIKGKNLLVDTSTDLRAQALRHKMKRIDAVLMTHPHADHVGGLDELRSFNFLQKERITLYGNAWTEQEVRARYSYIFSPRPTHQGGGIPMLDFVRIAPGLPVAIAGESVTPVRLLHGSDEVYGYRVGRFAYVTDLSILPAESEPFLRDLDVLILDCLRLTPHGTHLSLGQALEIVERVKPKKTYLTHMGHDFKYSVWARKLPKRVFLAYDGLRIRVPHKL